MASSTATDVAADATADAAADALLSRIRETLVGADDTLVAILRRLKATILAPTPSAARFCCTARRAAARRRSRARSTRRP